MNGKPILYIDQYGNKFYARTVKDLRAKLGGGRVSKMYIDTKNGTKHVGYVIGSHWLTAYTRVEKAA